MITRNDLFMKFHSETGKEAIHNYFDYENWVEASYLEKLNKDAKDKESIDELFTDIDGKQTIHRNRS